MQCSGIVDVDPVELRTLPARTYKDPLCSGRIVRCSRQQCWQPCRGLLCTTAPAETLFLNAPLYSAVGRQVCSRDNPQLNRVFQLCYQFDVFLFPRGTLKLDYPLCSTSENIPRASSVFIVLNLSSLSSLIPGCSFVSLRLLIPSDEGSLNRHDAIYYLRAGMCNGKSEMLRLGSFRVDVIVACIISRSSFLIGCTNVDLL